MACLVGRPMELRYLTCLTDPSALRHLYVLRTVHGALTEYAASASALALHSPGVSGLPSDFNLEPRVASDVWAGPHVRSLLSCSGVASSQQQKMAALARVL